MDDLQKQFAAFQMTEEMVEKQQRLRELDRLFHSETISISFQTVIQTKNTRLVGKEEIHYVELV
jgi:hypothetical protein